MIKITKFVKLTSIALVGTWLALLPSSRAFAGNEQTEQEVNDIIKQLMTPSEDGYYAVQLKNDEIINIRATLKEKIKTLKGDYEKTYENIKGKLEELDDVKEKIDKYKEYADLTNWQKFMTIVDPFGMHRGAWNSFTKGLQKFFDWVVGNDNDSVIRNILDGSFEWALENLVDDAEFLDINAFSVAKSSDKDKIASLTDLVTQYNNLVKAVMALAQEGMTNARQLDMAVEEYDAMPKTITSGQKLYSYRKLIGVDPTTGEEIYQQYYFILEGDTLKSISGATRGCIPLPAKLAESKSCIFCPLFKTIFNAAQNMSTKSYNKLASPLANVILIGFALVIAFMVLKNVSSFTKQDAPKFITELLVNIFKVLIAYYMLKNSTIVYGYIIGPILKGGFEFGASFLYATKDNYLNSCAAQTLPEGVPGGVMPAYLYTNLECFIKAVQAEVAVPQSIGSTLMCVARNAGETNVGPLRHVMWDFGMMFQGLAIWIMGWIISLAFAFYLIDATIQLGILGALMPFLIACWPFKLTSSYTGKGWNMFMNTFFVYVFMGLVVSINVELLGQGLTGGKGGFDAIKAALNRDSVQELKDILDIGFSGFLVLIACCLFGFKLTQQATSLAGTMGGGSSIQIGANIGGMAARVATKTTQGTLKTGLKTGKVVSDKIGLTSAVVKGKDKLLDGALGMIGLGRKSGAAGNKAAQNSFKKSQQSNGAPAQADSSSGATTPSAGGNGGRASSSSPIAQNQVKKMTQAGPRSQNPAKPENGVPSPQGAQTENSASGAQAQRPMSPEEQKQLDQQMRQQLEKDYQNSANGKAGQEMINTQAAVVSQKEKAEHEAFGKMNYHNRRANEYLAKSQKAADPAQKKQFEDLANQQFEEAVKAEAAYGKAKADTLKAQTELNNIKQENDKYKNEFVQTEMNKRNKKN